MIECLSRSLVHRLLALSAGLLHGGGKVLEGAVVDPGRAGKYGERFGCGRRSASSAFSKARRERSSAGFHLGAGVSRRLVAEIVTLSTRETGTRSGKVQFPTAGFTFGAPKPGPNTTERRMRVLEPDPLAGAGTMIGAGARRSVLGLLRGATVILVHFRMMELIG